MTSPKIALLGEAMLELSHLKDGSTRMAYGGDVLNTSIYLARLGSHPYFVSALGVDPYSDGLVKDWEQECVQTKFILRDPLRMPGLYAIQTDHRGERSFYYWRQNSAARNFFNLDGHEEALDFCKSADWFYLSGISLSLYSDAERKKLCSIARRLKNQGKHVVFDPNYRAKGWSNPETAQAVMVEFASSASIVLATIDDENELFGQMPGKQHAQNWHDRGVQTVILKCGPRGALIYEKGVADHKEVPVEVCENPVDTTGAGDSFNAAFIASLSRGADLETAVEKGNSLASQVIRFNGAIIPISAMPH